MKALLASFSRRHGMGGGGAVVLVATRTPAALCWRRLERSDAVGPGDSPAVLIRIGDCGRLARIARWLLLPFARARAERQLAAYGVAGAAGYAIAPTCEAPMWVYRVDSVAAAYAHSHLMPRGAGWRPLRAAVTWWTGCDPAVAGLLVVGMSDGPRYSAPRT